MEENAVSVTEVEAYQTVVGDGLEQGRDGKLGEIRFGVPKEV